MGDGKKNIDTSGAAFPASTSYGPNGEWNPPYNVGMTLRDYFAAAALPGWIQALSARYGEQGYSDDGALAQAVRLSLETADFMLEVGEK